MQFNQDLQRLGYRGSVSSRAQSLIAKSLAVMGAGVVLASAIAISLVVFAIAITGLTLFGGYLWWKTRHLRKQMRAQFQRGEVIEGGVAQEVQVRQVDR